MSLKKTLLLAVLALAGLFYIFNVALPSDEEQKASEYLFPRLGPAEVAKIEIKGKSGDVTLENTQVAKAGEDASPATGLEAPPGIVQIKAWKLAQVPEAELDHSALETLLSALGEVKPAQTVAEKDVGKDLAPYGLNPPELTLSATLRGKTSELQFGKENSYTGNRYLKVSDRKDLYLVDQALFAAANKKADDFRSRTPFAFLDRDLKSIVLTGPAGSARLEQTDAGKWALTAPARHEANPTAVSDLTREIRNIRVAEFSPDVPGEDEETPARTTIETSPENSIVMEWKDEKREPLRLKFKSAEAAKGAAAAYLVVSGKPSVYKVLIDPAKALIRTADDYRKRQFLKFVVDDVQKAEFTGAARPPLTIERKAEKEWTVNGKPADLPFVENVLRNVSELSASGFPPAEMTPRFDSPELKVVLSLKSPDGTSSERTLLVGGKTKDGAHFAGVDKLEEPFLVSEADLKQIQPREETLVQPAASPEPLLSPSSSPSRVVGTKTAK